MKKLILIIFSIALIVGCDENEGIELSYDLYKDYSVKTLYKTNEQGTYEIIHDTSDLNTIFSPLESIENPNWIDPGDFEAKVGIAITKDLPTCNCPELTIKKIKLKNDKIIYDYILPAYDTVSMHLCDGICRPYLLVLIDKNRLTEIDFYENGNHVKSIN